ncbi:unnamed protein product, partial [Rotaria socialis]
ENQVWIIQMTLCNDDEHDLKQVLTYMKQQIGSGETNLRTSGKVLCRMGKFDLAEKYLKSLLKELPSNHPLISSVYEDLGQLASQTAKAIPSTHSKEKTKRIQDSVSITGGHALGNQLNCPYGIYVDDDNQSIFIVDWGNHRIVEWKCDTKNSQVVAGGNGNGNRMDQLSFPTNVIVDKDDDSLIICDWGNRRVPRWPRRNSTNAESFLRVYTIFTDRKPSLKQIALMLADTSFLNHSEIISNLTHALVLLFLLSHYDNIDFIDFNQLGTILDN